MAFEIERKFLVKGDAWRGLSEPLRIRMVCGERDWPQKGADHSVYVSLNMLGGGVLHRDRETQAGHRVLPRRRLCR